MPRATIVIIDAKKDHHFQPGFTFVGAGLWSPADVTFRNADFLPPGIDWIEQNVAEFNPDANAVTTTGRQRVSYDFLFVATGLMLDYKRIEGMDTSLIGKNGITSIYAGPEAAAKSFREIDTFIDKGGVGLFGRPQTEMKCAARDRPSSHLSDSKSSGRHKIGAAVGLGFCQFGPGHDTQMNFIGPVEKTQSPPPCPQIR